MKLTLDISTTFKGLWLISLVTKGEYIILGLGYLVVDQQQLII
jgi:hypothetical protein